ncbi:PDDEXK family nuclease [Salimicrobium flavidum]|uniref:DUF91 domain-containing protein n=1 Tax=Salimicrobium flavidum TaxID=570947 RepID=A0A1N7KHK1_9BACI|nr:hypothetical protein [Salimicrobium flavidum]SIS61009.1 hypothetical protein SAMN05421687_1124 [Salimicrobium flavidum]
MYKINGAQVEPVDPDTFASLQWKENDIEELVRKNIEMICDDEESMLIVGKQVRNESSGISDLTAIDNNGSLVLIEIKWDRKDILRNHHPSTIAIYVWQSFGIFSFSSSHPSAIHQSSALRDP